MIELVKPIQLKERSVVRVGVQVQQSSGGELRDARDDFRECVAGMPEDGRHQHERFRAMPTFPIDVRKDVAVREASIAWQATKPSAASERLVEHSTASHVSDSECGEDARHERLVTRRPNELA
jgi:hypothetical protein